MTTKRQPVAPPTLGIETVQAIFLGSQGLMHADFFDTRRCPWHQIIFPTGGALLLQQ